MISFSRLLQRLLTVTLILPVLLFYSCDDSDDNPPRTTHAKQTVIMYMPWSREGIYSYFLQNLSAFEQSIESNNGLDGNALIVFISRNSTTSNLIKIQCDNGKCVRDTLKQYNFSSCNYTTAQGITSILHDAMAEAPADNYAMAIGCHGMGWIPVGTSVRTRTIKTSGKEQPMHLTRFFGHSSDQDYQTDISTLAQGINATGVKMQYILFDDCYMSNIETAYELRNVTNYLIASTCEIMIEGMPYAKIGIDLLNNNYKNICDGFYEFYSNFSYPYGTIGITDCNEVEGMANIMRQINNTYPDGISTTGSIQDLDGYEPTIFFDFGDYVSHLCTDASLLAMFNEQLERLVPYKAHTGAYYSSISNNIVQIHSFSGLTISDPTTNTSVSPEVPLTDWYSATH